MKLIKKVDAIEVKRNFIISDYLTQHKYFKKPLKTKNKKEYIKQLDKAKKIILELPELMLDMTIKGFYEKRWRLYNKMDWYIGTFKTNEVGVWKRSGEMPINWTRGSLEDTACFVMNSFKKNHKQGKKRFQTAIPGIFKNTLSLIQKDRYLFPIVLPGGTMGRGSLKKMKGDIDDGSMRSITLAMSGKKIIKAYIGVKKNNKK